MLVFEKKALSKKALVFFAKIFLKTHSTRVFAQPVFGFKFQVFGVFFWLKAKNFYTVKNQKSSYSWKVPLEAELTRASAQTTSRVLCECAVAKEALKTGKNCLKTTRKFQLFTLYNYLHNRWQIAPSGTISCVQHLSLLEFIWAGGFVIARKLLA